MHGSLFSLCRPKGKKVKREKSRSLALRIKPKKQKKEKEIKEKEKKKKKKSETLSPPQAPSKNETWNKTPPIHFDFNFWF